MYIVGIGTACPPARYTKTACLAAFEQSDWYGRLDAHAHLIARTVLQRDNGIEARRLAVDTLDEVFVIDPDTLAQRFRIHAPALAAQAAERALAAAGLKPGDIDAVIVSTCTGSLCPGLSGHVIERVGLRADVQAYDLVGQGCGAALPNLMLGRALLASRPSGDEVDPGGQGRPRDPRNTRNTRDCRHVLSVCVEISSAAMYLDNDPGVLISACLFGDGAGAAVLSRHPGPGRPVEWRDSASFTDPGHRQALMFEQRGGLLRNVLTRAVPALAADATHRLLGLVLGRAGLQPGDIATWILHAGGRDVLLALERRLELQDADLRYSAAMLREYGNLSSAFVYFVLQAALDDGAPPGWWWLGSFGAGFSAHGALLEVQ